jgi:hypothetical protein
VQRILTSTLMSRRSPRSRSRRAVIASLVRRHVPVFLLIHADQTVRRRTQWREMDGESGV